MVDFSLTAEDERWLDRARELAADFATRAREYDEDARFPAENFQRLREAGFLTLTVPRAYGGLGLWRDDRYLLFYRILETIAAGCSSTAQLLQVHSHAVGIIAWNANEAQRERYLGDVVRNGALIASCGSEATPGKATRERIESVLRPVEGGYRLTATKAFASLAPAADYYVVYVLAPGTTTVAEGYTTAVVAKDTPGVSFENTWDTMGMRPTVSWNLILDDVFVPADEVVGRPGSWVQDDPRTFTLAYCANHLGTAQGVLDFILRFVDEREHLRRDQVVLTTIGEMDAAIQATRSSMAYAAWLWERNRYDEAELASMRALHTSKQTAMMVATKAFDVCGARSGFKDLPLDRALRDVRMFSLHFRESVLLEMLAKADVGDPFHSKQKYGPKLERPPALVAD